MKTRTVKITIPHRDSQDEEQLARSIGQMVEDGMNECECGDGYTTKAVELGCDDTVPMVECGEYLFEITI